MNNLVEYCCPNLDNDGLPPTLLYKLYSDSMRHISIVTHFVYHVASKVLKLQINRVIVEMKHV